jgi:hypothetical protein
MICQNCGATVSENQPETLAKMLAWFLFIYPDYKGENKYEVTNLFRGAIREAKASDIIRAAKDYFFYCAKTGCKTKSQESWLREKCWQVDWIARSENGQNFYKSKPAEAQAHSPSGWEKPEGWYEPRNNSDREEIGDILKITMKRLGC